MAISVTLALSGHWLAAVLGVTFERRLESCMRWIVLLSIAAISGCATEADDPHLCPALGRVISNSELRGGSHSIRVIQLAPGELACTQQRGFPSDRGYCAATLSEVGLEFPHLYPWLVRDCLLAMGGRTQTDTVDEYSGLTGREKIVRLESILEDGTTVSLRFYPEDEGGPETGQLAHYFGTWHLRVLPRTRHRVE